MYSLSSSKTVQGLNRTHNQDSIYCNDNAGIWILADGMGGHAAGQEASSLVCEELSKLMLTGYDAKQSIERCHQVIYESQINDPTLKGMGSTLLLAYTDHGSPLQSVSGHIKDTIKIHWVGDSRAYLIKPTSICALTKDHSIVQNLIDLKLLDEHKARAHPDRNLLTQCLGSDQVTPPHVGVTTLQLKDNERILLCSDGLHNELSDNEIFEIIKHSDDLESGIQNLIKSAQDKKGADDISAILIDARTLLKDTLSVKNKPKSKLLEKVFSLFR